jgi:hypothetical protein
VKLSNSQKKKQLAVQHNFMRDWDMAIREDWLLHSTPRGIAPPHAASPSPKALVMLSVAGGLISQSEWIDYVTNKYRKMPKEIINEREI